MAHHHITSTTQLGDRLGHLLSGLPARLAHVHGATGLLALPAVHRVLSLLAVAALLVMLLAGGVNLVRGRFVLAGLSAVMGMVLFPALCSPLATDHDLTTLIGKVGRVHSLLSAASVFPAINEVLMAIGVIVIGLGFFHALKSLLRSHPIGAVVQAAAALVLGAVVSSASSLTTAYHLVLSL